MNAVRIFVDYSRRPLHEVEEVPVSRSLLPHLHVGDVVVTWGDEDLGERKARVLAIKDLPGEQASVRLAFLEALRNSGRRSRMARRRKVRVMAQDQPANVRTPKDVDDDRYITRIEKRQTTTPEEWQELEQILGLR